MKKMSDVINELREFLEAISVNDEISVYDHEEKIYFHRYGTDDYSIGFENGDWSSRGTKEDVINEFLEWFRQIRISNLLCRKEKRKSC